MSDPQIQIGQVTKAWAQQNSLTVKYSAVMESTNDLAKNEAFSKEALAESFMLYVTDHQTKGRGRGQHHWTSPNPGESLLSSWSFMLPFFPQPILVPQLGLALYRALIATWPYLPFSLKAPNDVFLGSKKCAGILVENITQGDETRLIVGLGLNVISAPKSESEAASLMQAMPAGLPLLGEDYVSFLDRLLLEMTQVISREEEELGASDQQALKFALNLNPNLTEKVQQVSAEGSLQFANRTVLWTDL